MYRSQDEVDLYVFLVGLNYFTISLTVFRKELLSEQSSWFSYMNW